MKTQFYIIIYQKNIFSDCNMLITDFFFFLLSFGKSFQLYVNKVNIFKMSYNALFTKIVTILRLFRIQLLATKNSLNIEKT